jgi:heme o synthase
MNIAQRLTVARFLQVRYYFDLTKPAAVGLHLVTTAAAMFVAASGVPSISVIVFTLAGGALAAGASNVLNCFIDRDLDSHMARTRTRPLPARRIRSMSALVFGLALAVIGLVILSLKVSLLAALLSLCALLYYDLVYTAWVKRRTRWAAIIGSGAGAFPPLIGWAAVTGSVTTAPLLMFAVVALWSPPHFWSLALYRRGEYRNAGLNVFPWKNAEAGILGFTLALFTASMLLIPAAGFGTIYAVAAVIMGVNFIVLSSRLLRGRALAAQTVYYYSMVYLLILFAAMVADKLT